MIPGARSRRLNWGAMLSQEIGEGVWVFRSRFADMLSTLVQLDGRRAALVDPPMFADEADEIRGFAGERGLSIEFLVITHAHGDHAYGIAHFPDALVLAQSRFWEYWREIEATDRVFFSRLLPEYVIPELRCPNLLLANGSRLRFERELSFRHVPGHSPDGLLVELPAEGIWIAGDTVLRIPFISSGERTELLMTLRELGGRFRGEAIVPGHGRVLRGEEARRLLAENILYLERLGTEVERAVREGGGLEEAVAIPLTRFGIPEGAVGGLAAWIHRENLKKVYEELSGR